MKLYLVRHGETDWNKEGKIQGTTDIPLNDNGRMQILKTKEQLQNINFDICISSPLKRAKETAQIITDGNCQIVYEDLLKERTIGNFEGKTFKEIPFDIKVFWDYKVNYHENNVQSLKDLLKQSDDFIQKLKSNYNNYNSILIVSHGATIKSLYYNLNGYDENTNFYNFFIENGQIYEFDLK